MYIVQNMQYLQCTLYRIHDKMQYKQDNIQVIHDMHYARDVQHAALGPHAAHMKSLCGPLSHCRVLLPLVRRNKIGLFYHLKIVSLYP